MIYRQGSSGKEVAEIQAKLGLEADGHFGVKTRAAVVGFQRDHGLNADGVVGALTWQALFGQAQPRWYPDGPLLQRDCLAVLGDPHESSFRQAEIVFIDLAEFKLDYAHLGDWHTRQGFGLWGHYLTEMPLKAALRYLAQAGGAKLLVTWDGCFNVRYIRGTTTLSVHSWALADDFNALTNPLGGKCTMSPTVVACFARAGWEWGGLWQSPKDGMHFQLCWTRDWTYPFMDQAALCPADWRPQAPRWEAPHA